MILSAERNSGKFSDRVLLLGEGDQVVLTRSVLFNYPSPLSLFRATMKKMSRSQSETVLDEDFYGRAALVDIFSFL